jgi:hypothetical protein
MRRLDRKGSSEQSTDRSVIQTSLRIAIVTDRLLDRRVRATRHWYRDGLSEIPLGVVLLLLSGSNLIAVLGNRASAWYEPVTLIYAALFVALALCGSRIMAAVRERVTYPRSGYACPPLSGWKRLAVTMGLALLVAVAVAGALVAQRYQGRAGGWDAERLLQWLPAGGGLSTGVLGVYVTLRYGLPRFLIVGALAVVLGVVTSIEYPPRLASRSGSPLSAARGCVPEG